MKSLGIRNVFNLILGIILCILVMKYNQEIVSFLISSGSIDSLINYLQSLKEPK
jgi:hypothetical protein